MKGYHLGPSLSPSRRPGSPLRVLPSHIQPVLLPLKDLRRGWCRKAIVFCRLGDPELVSLRWWEAMTPRLVPTEVGLPWGPYWPTRPRNPQTPVLPQMLPRSQTR